MNFTPSSFYSKYLQGNEMTDFVEKFIDYDDIDFMPTDEDDEDTYADVYLWYKVKDIGDNDIIELALKRCCTLPFFTCKGCLFIGMTWWGISYENVEIFQEFCKAIGNDLSEENKIRKDGVLEELTDNKIDKQIKELQEQNKELVEELSINKSLTSQLVEELSIMKTFTSHLVTRLDEQKKELQEQKKELVEDLSINKSFTSQLVEELSINKSITTRLANRLDELEQDNDLVNRLDKLDKRINMVNNNLESLF